MEKYGRWRDPATGVHPFLEPRKQFRGVGRTARDLLVAVVLLPIKGLALGWFGALGVLAAGMEAAGLSALAAGVWAWACRGGLAACGVWSVGGAREPAAGRVGFCNLQSVLDVLVCGAATGARRFAFPVDAGSDQVVLLGPWDAAARIARARPLTLAEVRGGSQGSRHPSRDVQPMLALLDGVHLPGYSVVFAEGATTNGSLLLRTPDLLPPAVAVLAGRAVDVLSVRYGVPSDEVASPCMALEGQLASKLLAWAATPVQAAECHRRPQPFPASMDHVTREWRRALQLKQARSLTAWDKPGFLDFFAAN